MSATPPRMRRGCLLRARCVIVGGLVVLLAVGSLAGLDEVDERLRLAEADSALWENVRGRPFWHAGVRPEARVLRGGADAAVLHPGDFICVKVPGFERLGWRIEGEPGDIGRRTTPTCPLDAGISNGSGLIVMARPVVGADERTCFLDPQSPDPTLVYLVNPPDAELPVEVSLFISRRLNPGSQVDYRESVPLKRDDVVVLSSTHSANGGRFWRVRRGERVALSVAGGGRFQLEMRGLVSTTESASRQSWNVVVEESKDRKSQTLATIEFLSSADSAEVVRVGDAPVQVTGLEQGYFNLPGEGRRPITLVFASAGFVRLHRIEESGFLLPHWNAPRDLDTALGDSLASPERGRSPWALDEDEMITVMNDPRAASIDRIDRVGMRLLWDNSRMEGGMLASDLLNAAAVAVPQYPDIRRRWRDLLGAGTSFRALLPGGDGMFAPREGCFGVRRLQDIGEPRDWVVAWRQLRESGLRSLPGAIFMRLPRGGSPLFYALPDRFGTRTLRLAAEREAGNGDVGDRDFWIRFDDLEAVRMRLCSREDAEMGDIVPSAADAALAMTPGGTLDAAFAQSRRPRPMVDAGWVEIPVPAGVSSMRLWASEGGEGLPVAVSVRESVPFALNEDAYLHLVDRIGGIEAARSLMFDFLAADDPGAVAARSAELRALVNHWEPLRRHVRSRHLRFVGSVPHSPPSGEAVDWQARVDAFLAAGEFHLAEHLCRWIYLHSGRDDGVTRDAAWARLRMISARHLDADRTLTNLCAAMVEEPGTQHGADLCKELRNDGRHDLALMLASVLPHDRETLEASLASAFRERWWATFDRFLERGEGSEVAGEFRGRRAWLEGHFGDALAAWRRAGRMGDALIGAVEESATIRTGVARGEREALRAWAEWETGLPGRRSWRPAPISGVVGARGAAAVRILESGDDVAWLVASPDQPVRIRFASPRLLKLECRPLHPSGSREAVDGWIAIEAQGMTRRVPVINNFPSSGLTIEGDRRRVPGLLVGDVFALGAWNGEIEVRPDGFPMLVRVLQSEPEFPVGHLPPLEFETAATIWRSDARWLACGESVSRAWGEGRIHGRVRAGTAVVVEADGSLQELALCRSHARPGESDLAALRNVLDGMPQARRARERDAEWQILERARRLLWRVGQGDPVDRGMIAETACLVNTDGTLMPEAEAVLGRLLTETEWTPLLSPARGAGIQRIETEGWFPEDPGLRRRTACLDSIGADEQFVAGTDSLVISVAAPDGERVKVRLTHDSLPFLPAEEIPVRLEATGAAPVEMVLESGCDPSELVFDLPSGGGYVRIDVGEVAPNHFVRVAAAAERNPEALRRTVRRDWFVATAAEPLEWPIVGPAWVRIDSLKSGQVSTRFAIIGEGEGALVLQPEDGEGDQLCRVHALVPAPGKRGARPVFREVTVSPIPPPLAAVRAPLRAESGPVGDGREPDWEGSMPATWSFGAGWERRRALEEDESGELAPDEFFQWEAVRRNYVEAWGAYSRSTVLVRARTAGDPVLGVEQSLQIRPFGRSATITLTGDAYLQGDDWSAGFRGTISGKRSLGRQLAHLPSATLFLRATSLDGFDGPPATIDQDVFTPYKDEHGRGLSLGERLILTPFQDMMVFAGVGLTTNEDFNVLDPDSVHYRVGAEQRLGLLQLGAELRGYRFLADEDRPESLWRHRLSIEASGEWRVRDGQRIEAVASYTRFFEDDDNAFSFFLRWHLDGGRGLRDFRPDERPFAAIRERQLRLQRNQRAQGRRRRGGRGRTPMRKDGNTKGRWR